MTCDMALHPNVSEHSVTVTDEPLKKIKLLKNVKLSESCNDRIKVLSQVGHVEYVWEILNLVT